MLLQPVKKGLCQSHFHQLLPYIPPTALIKAWSDFSYKIKMFSLV